MKVKTMTTAKGNKARNQFVVRESAIRDGTTVHRKIFISYETIIAVIERVYYQTGDTETVSLDENYWDYSRTTSKYRNIFLNADTAQVKNRVASGEYTLTDLN